jgi:hypothetical protein
MRPRLLLCLLMFGALAALAVRETYLAKYEVKISLPMSGDIGTYRNAEPLLSSPEAFEKFGTKQNIYNDADFQMIHRQLAQHRNSPIRIEHAFRPSRKDVRDLPEIYSKSQLSRRLGFQDIHSDVEVYATASEPESAIRLAKLAMDYVRNSLAAVSIESSLKRWGPDGRTKLSANREYTAKLRSELASSDRQIETMAHLEERYREEKYVTAPSPGLTSSPPVEFQISGGTRNLPPDQQMIALENDRADLREKLRLTELDRLRLETFVRFSDSFGSRIGDGASIDLAKEILKEAKRPREFKDHGANPAETALASVEIEAQTILSHFDETKPDPIEPQARPGGVRRASAMLFGLVAGATIWFLLMLLETWFLSATAKRRPEAVGSQLLAYSALVISGVGATAVLLLADPEVKLVILPVLVVSWVFATFASVLYFHDGQTPLFHAGFFAAGTALVYIALPAVFFAISGFEWSQTSDQRLVSLNIQSEDVAGYVWRGALYLSAFCATYILMVRNLAKPPRTSSIPITASDVAVCVLIIAGCFFCQRAVEVAFGVSLSEADAVFPADGFNPNLPLVIAQATHNIAAIQRLAKLALVVALVGLWTNRWAKFALVAFLASELFSMIALFGPRTYFAFLVLATLLAFHKLVRPIGVPVLGACVVVFLALLLAYGYARNYSDDVDFSTANEFQVLMVTAFHVRDMVQSGLKVPPQIPWSELLMLIPQQLLPIEKIDPSIWYLVESGYSESGSGYMFGVQSQAEVGWGNPELFLRGVLLAVGLGFLHRQYLRRSDGFLPTVSYIWLLTVIYYSYRAATFYWVTFIAFRLLVFVGIFLMLRRLVSIFRAGQPLFPMAGAER